MAKLVKKVGISDSLPTDISNVDSTGNTSDKSNQQYCKTIVDGRNIACTNIGFYKKLS